MRAATRALGGNPAHATRLKGATARRVRRLAARRSRGAVALFKRVFYALAAPSGVSPHGVIFVPHFMREHGGEGIPAFGREATHIFPRSPAGRFPGLNPIP